MDKIVLFKNIEVLACKCLKYLITEGSIKIWKWDSEDIFLCRRESVFQADFLKARIEDSKRQRIGINPVLCKNYHLPRNTIQWLKTFYSFMVPETLRCCLSTFISISVCSKLFNSLGSHFTKPKAAAAWCFIDHARGVVAHRQRPVEHQFVRPERLAQQMLHPPRARCVFSHRKN